VTVTNPRGRYKNTNTLVLPTPVPGYEEFKRSAVTSKNTKIEEMN